MAWSAPCRNWLERARWCIRPGAQWPYPLRSGHVAVYDLSSFEEEEDEGDESSKEEDGEYDPFLPPPRKPGPKKSRL